MSLPAALPRRARVVVADDSALMRRLVSDVLTEGGLEVAGAAGDGDEAVALCRSLRPDALTLDLSMPGMGGIDVLRALRAGDLDLPVVVVSAFSPAQGAYAVDALAEGAFELVTKPTGRSDTAVFEQMLLGRVTLAVSAHRRARPPAAAAARSPRHFTGVSKVVVIAVSTGGPRALSVLVPELPSPLGLGTVIVQHMPAGFTSSLAERLNRCSPLTVREAAGAEQLDPCSALLAPGGLHLRIDETGHTALSEAEAVGGLRPRADLTIEDLARRHGRRLVLVVMTGMGQDGLRGAQAVKRHGGRVLAEAEETCTVYGMPRAVAQAGLADRVVPLHELAGAIAEEAGR